MSGDTPVSRLYNEGIAVIAILKEGGEVSLESATSDNLRKSLLLAAASHFENRITLVVSEFIKENAGGSLLLEQFVRNRAIARQYHTWFKWDETSANQFFGMFGPEFRAMMTEKVRSDDLLRGSIRAFLELGNERNRLAHSDYATFPLEKTFEEIHELYLKGVKFVEFLPVALRECDKQTRGQPG